MMNNYLYIIIEGIIVFTLVFLFNYFFFVRKMKKFRKSDMPLELIYLSKVCDINPTKVDYHKFQIAYCFINAFIITTDYLLVVHLVKNDFLKIVLGIVLVILLIIVCYGLLGRYYKMKEIKEKTKKS